MKRSAQDLLTPKIFLWIVLGCAAALRFYNFAHIPFTHDEFSALSRVRFNSFNDFVQYGVLPDFHPAGVQFFLWRYTQLFGTTPWVVKLPFALIGLATVYLVYRLGRDWFSVSTALLVAAFVACSQYFILYSQVARPYGPALFFCLIALYGWKKLVFEERTSLRTMLYWILGAALAAYSHYFALLFLVLVGVSGLFFLNRATYKAYVLSALCIFLLFVPHLSIFFAQLAKGGVEGWLGKPNWGFVPNYLAYLLHYSWVFGAIVAGIVVLGVLLPARNKQQKLAWLGIGWWAACFLIGFYYSVHRSAILQYSGLLFAAPFGLLGCFSLFRFRAMYVPWASVCLLLAGGYSLIYERAHYFSLYASPYTELVQELGELDMDKAHLLLAQEEHIYKAYASENGLDTARFSLINDLNVADFDALLDTLNRQQIGLGLLYYAPPEFVALAKERYPFVVQHKRYYQGEFWHLSRSPESNAVPNEVYFARKGKQPPQWLTAEAAYAKGIELRGLDTLIRHKHDRFVFAAQARGQGVLASALMLGDSVLNWQSSDVIPRKSSANSWQYHSFELPEKEAQTKGAVLKLFVWNTGADSLWVGNQNVTLEKGNPYVYGLYEAF